MSILIKGMEMPKSCGDCPCLGETYCCCVDGVYPYDCNILIQETEEGSELIGRLSNCPLVEVPKWIPVTERLPEINQKVLVFSFYTMHVYKFCALDEKCGAAEDHWQDDYGIVHGIEEVQFWMPLPQPPEEG